MTLVPWPTNVNFPPLSASPVEKSAKNVFFWVVFLKNAASGGKYKLCTLSDASCQGASFATLFGCVPANWAEKTSKKLLKNREGHFVWSMQSQNAEIAV